MPTVDVPHDIHEAVKDYAQDHGMSVPEAYVELVEYALNNIGGEDEDEDLQSGII
ncbi:MAG: hypothetical protein SV377_06040 [Halobacteria archaeon]|nr:hypothetical protein [Halobacteria archaeon]